MKVLLTESLPIEPEVEPRADDAIAGATPLRRL